MIPKRTEVTEKAGWHKEEDVNAAKPKNLVAEMVPDNYTMGLKRVWKEGEKTEDVAMKDAKGGWVVKSEETHEIVLEETAVPEELPIVEESKDAPVVDTEPKEGGKKKK